jgi:hypothetical protein
MFSKMSKVQRGIQRSGLRREFNHVEVKTEWSFTSPTLMRIQSVKRNNFIPIFTTCQNACLLAKLPLLKPKGIQTWKWVIHYINNPQISVHNIVLLRLWNSRDLKLPRELFSPDLLFITQIIRHYHSDIIKLYYLMIKLIIISQKK